MPTSIPTVYLSLLDRREKVPIGVGPHAEAWLKRRKHNEIINFAIFFDWQRFISFVDLKYSLALIGLDLGKHRQKWQKMWYGRTIILVHVVRVPQNG